MSIRKREGNRPNRRIADETTVDETTRKELVEKLRYVGSAIHKLHPGNYRFQPPQNPRPSKTPCDALRVKCEVRLNDRGVSGQGKQRRQVRQSEQAIGNAFVLKTGPPDLQERTSGAESEKGDADRCAQRDKDGQERVVEAVRFVDGPDCPKDGQK